jgi:hypothetical protein
MKKIIMVLVLLILLPYTGEAADAPRFKDMTLAVGKIRVPEDLIVTEIDFNSFFESGYFHSMMTEVMASESAWRNPAEFKMAVEFLNSLSSPETREVLNSINIYQFGLWDGAAYHYALAASIRDNRQWPPYLRDFFRGAATAAKQAKLNDVFSKTRTFVAEITSENGLLDFSGAQTVYLKDYIYTDNLPIKYSFGVEKLELGGPEFFTINKQPAFSASFRSVGQVGPFFKALTTKENTVQPGPFFTALYAKAYCFSLKKQPAALFFVTVDSDRDFWTELFDRAVTDGFKPAKMRGVK